MKWPRSKLFGNERIQRARETHVTKEVQMASCALVYMYARMRDSMSAFSMREDTEMRPEEVILASGTTAFLFRTSGGNCETGASL